MSSILTNTSAMVALQTMKSINSNLNRTQQEISTGKTVATAKDNATVWMTLAFEEEARRVWISSVSSAATSVADSSRE